MLPVGGDAGLAISQAFVSKDIVKHSTGEVVGTVFQLNNRKAIATQLNLLGKANKDELDAAILERSDTAFRHVKSEIAGLNGEWTLHKVANRVLGSGVRQITVVVREVSRKRGPTDEAIAEAMGMTIEAVREARERQTRALEARDIDADTTTETAPPTPTPAPTPAPTVRVVRKPKAPTA